MCGILGVCIAPHCREKENLKEIVARLFLLSESRGKEASGMALNNGTEIRYLKSPFPASELVRSRVFSKELQSLSKNTQTSSTIIGHSRLVTHGYEHDNKNNQPVVKQNIIAVHNGIIVNYDELWKKYPNENRLTELDSELIPTLINRFMCEGLNLQQAIARMYDDIYGMTTTAMLFSHIPILALATNNGSAYYSFNTTKSAFIFASERFILSTLLKGFKNSDFEANNIKQLQPNNYLLLNSDTFDHLLDNVKNCLSKNIIFHQSKAIPITEISAHISKKHVRINTSLEHGNIIIPKYFMSEYKKRQSIITSLRRCAKCLLPETFPFIEFDEMGVCNYCRKNKPLQFMGKEKLIEHMFQLRNSDKGAHDCLVPFSGGRDSSYALHFIKKEVGMNPIAFSYDWGMLTDLGRRNQSRMCGALGVEHILVSADIRKKRDNIRKNVTAWLKRPRLCTIPLFMAGDKQYFYFTNLLMKQNNLKLSIFGENMLETTRFKSGFCGIKPRFDSMKTYSLTFGDKIQMALYYSKEYLFNPEYINSSLFDTVDAFKSYYVIKHHNVNLFDYIKWDENAIAHLLINQYDWETDPGTSTTWRIGDGTAAFYNYIYYMVAGFTENDTFRSNQIREGMIDRDTALKIATEDNKPRFDSIKWYCDTIGIDFVGTVKRINEIPTLYEV